jgi:putative transposase
MLKAFKVRLYPNKIQANYFAKAIVCARAIFNMMLHDANEAYEEYKKSIEGMSADEKKAHKFKHKINYSIYPKQETTSFLKEIEARALNCVQRNLETAFDNFFKGRAKHPEYHKKSIAGSFQSDKIKVNGHKLKVPKCPGMIQFRNYEDINFAELKTRTITISRSSTGKYFASILCEVPDAEPLPKTGNTVGIDLGVSTAVTFDDGRKIDRRSIVTKKKYFRGNRNGDDPRVKEVRNKIEFYQAKKMRAGTWTVVTFTGKDGKEHQKRKLVAESGNYKRYKKKVAALTEQLYNMRNNYINETARFVVDNADVICMEDLAIKGGLLKDVADKSNRQNGTTHRNIAEASMGRIATKIKSMASTYGKTVVEVDPAYTSRTCHCCGNKLTEKLVTSIREWTCAKCGAHHDRDVNAAMNIKQAGLAKLAANC